MLDLVFESVETATPEEFARFVAERERQGDIHHYELLNGRIVMTPPAGYPHGSIDNLIGRRIGDHVEAGRLGRVFGSSQGFELPTGDTVQPDVSYVSEARWRQGPSPRAGEFLRMVPDLVVEILSTRTASRDRGEKKAAYERSGVLEYWVVDPRARTVMRFLLREGRFDGGVARGEGEAVDSEVLAGFRLDVADVFAA